MIFEIIIHPPKVGSDIALTEEGHTAAKQNSWVQPEASRHQNARNYGREAGSELLGVLTPPIDPVEIRQMLDQVASAFGDGAPVFISGVMDVVSPAEPRVLEPVG